MTAPSPADVVIEAEAWLADLPDFEAVAGSAVTMALDATGLSDVPAEVTVLACDDARIAELNRDFREKDRATNVLSWPTFALDAPISEGLPEALVPTEDPAPIHLGDIAIAHETTLREAAEYGISLKCHTTHLILHGCLHLLGYTHDSEADAALMEGIETDQMVRAGFPDPYA